VTVKARPGSVGTRWMLDHLRPRVCACVPGEPGGSFSILRRPAAKYLLISAGSGITPMMSMTAFPYDFWRAPEIVFVNCPRRPQRSHRYTN